MADTTPQTTFLDSTRTPSTNSIATPFIFRSNSLQSHDSSAVKRVAHEHHKEASGVLLTPLQTTRLALRKKPKSISISSAPILESASAHMRRLSGIPKTLSYPTFHPHSEPDENRPVSAHSAHPPSTPKLLPTNIPNRSPSQKRRPPASHSSYGVETSLGPPPSYTTQQQDRRNQKGGTGTGPVAERVTPQPQLNEAKQQQRDVPTIDHLTALPVLRPSDSEFSSPETFDSQSSPREGSDTTPPTSAGGTKMNEFDETTITRGLGLDATQDDAKASSSDETQKSEDLFLNIAKTDASRPDKRRSRISLPFFSGTRPATAAARSSPMSTHFESSLQTRSERAFGKRSSLGQHVPGALTSSSFFDDTRSQAGRPTDLRSNIDSADERSQLRSRRYSNANADTLRPPTRSRTSRLASENLCTERHRLGERVATESTISTTAPSTVWSELDDLKSRIKKLELTGKLPPSSAAAMTTTERPRTATTAATTMSSSPKHNKPPVTALPSAIEGVSSTVHPLLHEALTNAKASVNPDVYQKLQATAQDALQLSTMLSQEGYGVTGSALPPQTERQIRRRTESMCRGLTELAIALLAESRGPTSPTARPGSCGQHSGAASVLRTRTFSDEAPSERPSASARVQSRLESRRTSMLLSHSQASPTTETPPSNPTYRTPPASVISQPGTSSRVSRTSTVTRSRRSQNHKLLDGTTDNEDDPSPSVSSRPVSRAATDIGTTYRTLARDRATFSREYTKQHPLPGSHQASEPSSTSTRVGLPSNLSITSRVSSRRKHPSPSTANDIISPSQLESSPLTAMPSFDHYDAHRQAQTPSHVPRPPFTISIERRPRSNHGNSASNSPATATSTPESTGAANGTERRPSSTRRSLGFASRISNVSNRLKQARAERMASANHAQSPLAKERDPMDAQDVENAVPVQYEVAVGGGNS